MTRSYSVAPSRAAEELGIVDKPTQKPNRAVAEHRHSARDKLDLFPTPPWATRALVEIVLPKLDLSIDGAVIWECAAGLGHMAHVLAEYAGLVVHSDVHDYGIGSVIGSFVGEGPDVIGSHCEIVAADWIITNPPYNLAEAFLRRALREAPNVALLLRTAFIDTQGRYERVFKVTPPRAVAQFAERCPMHEGRWDPDGDTATAYAWFVWTSGATQTELMWIPPGQRDALEHPRDRARFAELTEGSLL